MKWVQGQLLRGSYRTITLCLNVYRACNDVAQEVILEHNRCRAFGMLLKGGKQMDKCCEQSETRIERMYSQPVLGNDQSHDALEPTSEDGFQFGCFCVDLYEVVRSARPVSHPA